jgi:formylglycine-generating enzyme
MKNSIGMELVEIPAGSFAMGQTEGGDDDERPVHQVIISRPFAMTTTPVTNAQYECFDPQHRNLRGKRELSRKDDEAAIFVSWHDAVRFCAWLSESEGKPYRLPTEAEWEYACRAGTRTTFHTGDELPEAYHRHQEGDWHPTPVSLEVGQTPANPFGLVDMHGLVEEWCHDWYGPYASDPQTDPVGRTTGTFKVTRGGSHNADLPYLRSANRLATLPEDSHWLIGFRVVQADLPSTEPLPAASPPLHMTDVQQESFNWTPASAIDEPLFIDPIPFVRKPEPASATPFFPHNHCPSITWCPNGDLLAIWFSTIKETGREMTILSSRLRAGSDAWEPASEFFKAADRNMTGSSLFHDGSGTIYHANGLEAAGHWANLALVIRSSRDSGATWSIPSLANPEHQPRNQVISGMSSTPEGWLIQPCDAVYGGSGGTAIHISRDRGQTWTDPGADTPKPDFQGNTPGCTIAGIHAGVVTLKDGSLLAFGRGDSRLGMI